MMGKKRKVKEVKRRNPYALIASWRSGAGRHTDQKKRMDKEACRKPVGEE